jgi:MYXO-CTERM domain-containing protein
MIRQTSSWPPSDAFGGCGTSSGEEERLKRWLLLPLALAVAALAAYAILTGPRPGMSMPSREREAAAQSGEKARVSPVPVQHGEIRDPSREKLREILRDAERDAG